MAGSTNIQQFNPTAANQENDTTYTGDSQRVNGVATDAIIPSASINKSRYQVSTVAAALALALSNKGYVISDGSPGAVPLSGGQSAAVTNLAAVLANILTNADVPTIFNNSALTGIPTAPTAAFGTNTNQLATMAALLAYGLRLSGPGLRLEMGSTTGTNISFSPPFSAVPILVAMGKGGSININSKSTTGASFNTSGVSEIDWIAIGAA